MIQQIMAKKKPPGWEAFCPVPGAIPPAWLCHAVPPLHKGGPVAGRPYSLCCPAYNRPFLRHPARIALWVRCPDGHTLFAARHTTSHFCGTRPGLHPRSFRCWLASTGARSHQRIQPSASYGRPDTGHMVRLMRFLASSTFSTHTVTTSPT